MGTAAMHITALAQLQVASRPGALFVRRWSRCKAGTSREATRANRHGRRRRRSPGALVQKGGGCSGGMNGWCACQPGPQLSRRAKKCERDEAMCLPFPLT